jgi:hypothetical protein
MIVDPLDDLLGARRTMHPRRFDIDGVRDADIEARRSNASSAPASTNVKSGEVSVTIRLKGPVMGDPATPGG